MFTHPLSLPARVSLPQLHLRARLVRVAPSRRSIAVGVGLGVLALGGYLLARESSLFALRRIVVLGGSPRVAGQVRRALAPLAGKALVGLDGSAVLRTVDALPTVVRANYDRDFPHTLRITIVPEQPAAILRRGADSWLVSSRGRVMKREPSLADPTLPRIWVSARTPVQIGSDLTTPGAAAAARAAGLAGAFATRVTTVSYVDGTLVFHLRSGLALVLGGGAGVRLKVAVAERTLPALPAGSTFLDVSVPGRPVSGAVSAIQTSSKG